MSQEGECEEGKLWNKDLEFCDLEENVTCRRGRFCHSKLWRKTLSEHLSSTTHPPHSHHYLPSLQFQNLFVSSANLGFLAALLDFSRSIYLSHFYLKLKHTSCIFLKSICLRQFKLDSSQNWNISLGVTPYWKMHEFDAGVGGYFFYHIQTHRQLCVFLQLLPGIIITTCWLFTVFSNIDCSL